MKKFTKVALIVAAVLTVFGIALGISGLALGATLGGFRELLEAGKFSIDIFDFKDEDDMEEKVSTAVNGWKNAEVKRMEIDAAGIDSIFMDIGSGQVQISEGSRSDCIEVIVTYKKQDHKRQVVCEEAAGTLQITDDGDYNIIGDDSSVFVQINLPPDKEYEQMDLRMDAGELNVKLPLTADNINLELDAGECKIQKDITAHSRLCASVDAGELDISRLKAKELELNTNVGEIDVDSAAADDTVISCDIGTISANFEGKSADYNYQINCDVGSVELDGESKGGLDKDCKEEHHGASKNMEINCKVGEVKVDFLN